MCEHNDSEVLCAECLGALIGHKSDGFTYSSSSTKSLDKLVFAETVEYSGDGIQIGEVLFKLSDFLSAHKIKMGDEHPNVCCITLAKSGVVRTHTLNMTVAEFRDVVLKAVSNG